MAQNLKVNDQVKIIAGDHKGETAKIVKMDRKNHKAMLEGIGVRERHLRKPQFNPPGGIIASTDRLNSASPLGSFSHSR